MNIPSFRSQVKVSALVSTYSSEKYIKGCLEDLTQQTLFQKGQLEIIILDCSSPEDEALKVREFQKANANITYVRISERETLYGAWNLGLKFAQGQYITNANTDDRHSSDSLEKMSIALDAHPQVELVYADVYQSNQDNETFAANNKQIRLKYKKYFAPDVLLHYQFGCQPMWRANLHEKIGFFNPELKAAGDYEFNFKFCLAGLNAHYIPEPLGSFLERSNSISTANSTSTDEQQLLRQKYITADNILKLYQNSGWPAASMADQIAIFSDLHLRASGFELPWHPGQHFRDAGVASLCEQVLQILQGPSGVRP